MTHSETIEPLLLNCIKFFSSHILPTNSARIFHGRGQCYKGLEWCALDYFNPVVLLTVFGTPEESLLNTLIESMKPIIEGKATHFVIQRRDINGAPYTWVSGAPFELNSVFACRDNLKFYLDFNQQNCGYFLDMEPGRQWLSEHAKGARVLNLFAYTCAFSVVAVEFGANKVINVDLSKRSLTTGRENHRVNQHDMEKVSFLGVDILKSWGKLKKMGPYDIVIVDPPSFQKGSFVATKDYQKVVRRLPDLLGGNGQVLACLNAPEFSSDYLKTIFDEQAAILQFKARLEPSTDFPDVDIEQQLKMLIYQIKPD